MKVKLFVQVLVAVLVSLVLVGCNCTKHRRVMVPAGRQMGPQVVVTPAPSVGGLLPSDQQLPPVVLQPPTVQLTGPVPNLQPPVPLKTPVASAQPGHTKLPVLLLYRFCPRCVGEDGQPGKFWNWTGGRLEPGVQLFWFRPDWGKWALYDKDYNSLHYNPKHPVEAPNCPLGHRYLPTTFTNGQQ